MLKPGAECLGGAFKGKGHCSGESGNRVRGGIRPDGD